MPKWKPATRQGEAICLPFLMPFRLRW